MLHRQYLLQYNIFRHLLPRHFLQRQLRSKSSRRFNGGRSNHEEDDGNVRRKIENQEANIYLLKSRGQHLLTNPRVLDSIVGKSNVLPTDTVLEIGPGTGNLTLKLIVCQGALKTEFPRFDLMVANIPYGISSPLVAKLVFGANAYRSATLLLQKEFARRLLANPGDSEFNRLAVNVKLVADVEFVMDVSKRDFLPCPKVDSSVVKIHPKASIPDVNLDEWWAFTRTCFTKKNKTLGATFKQKRLLMELMKLQESVEDCNLQSGLEIIELASFREMIMNILSSGGFDDKRPSKLSHEELLHLLSLFNQSGISFHGPAKPKNPRQTTFAAACDPT
ncbi:ribosomal RNA small subunit methyltransferase, mitochondrial isoform X2 [Ipomoea triloba]|uniref:ribosomal RNA small subunit methyltransferase, mitochondrial isoform X2 n=1 Tax=Ipomoea triloba TaxID=35885 RepID=UPI00125E10E5|nr:ribosomal RNA small subunit methyltransferase, mitochondrial isoform X2 [Ipomoea triloba]